MSIGSKNVGLGLHIYRKVDRDPEAFFFFEPWEDVYGQCLA